MICYKDRTWCDAVTCKHKGTCDRFFTAEENLKANKWMHQPPICFFVNPQQLDCYEAEDEESQ